MPKRYTKAEQAANRAEWVKDLRSGRFNRARHALRSGNGHCCLGVACETFRRVTGQGEWTENRLTNGVTELVFQPASHSRTSGIVLPPAVRSWLGVSSEYGDLIAIVQDADNLAKLNDQTHVSFDDIADEVERGNVQTV